MYLWFKLFEELMRLGDVLYVVDSLDDDFHETELIEFDFVFGNEIRVQLQR